MKIRDFCKILLLLTLTACASVPPQAPLLTNSPEQLTKPYVVLVSIDGYRHDYNQKFKPPTLMSIARNGVRVEGWMPVYPSKTFPNHYSMATGLYADRHGIVSNSFYDPERRDTYSIGVNEKVQDGSWYEGEPMWVVAAKNKMVSASFYWIGSEGLVQGLRPTYYKLYNKDVTNQERVSTALSWLKLPEVERPHLVLMYFSTVDTAGHRFGTKSQELKDAVKEIDERIRDLRQGLKETGLPVNLIVVSDHGMQDFDKEKTYYPDELTDLSAYEVVDSGPQMMLYLKPGMDELQAEKQLERTVKQLKDKMKHIRVLRHSEIPASWHFSKSKRVGDILLSAKNGWALRTRAMTYPQSAANHGWEPKSNPNMWGIFYAEGPAFKANQRVRAMENINLYPLVLRLLNLPIGKDIDGRAEPFRSALRPGVWESFAAQK